jgi:hypothetical protein
MYTPLNEKILTLFPANGSKHAKHSYSYGTHLAGFNARPRALVETKAVVSRRSNRRSYCVITARSFVVPSWISMNARQTDNTTKKKKEIKKTIVCRLDR